MAYFKLISFFLIFLIEIIITVAVKDGSCPNFVSKKAWGGRRAVEVDYTLIPIEYVVIHHTVTPECNTDKSCKENIQSIQDYHMDELDYPDIGYNFLIGGNGKIYEGRGWHKVGAHAVGYNSRSLGIAIIGDFRDKLPNPSQLTATKELLKCGVDLGELSKAYKLFGARQVISTVSPGKKLYQEIQTWEHFSTL